MFYQHPKHTPIVLNRRHRLSQGLLRAYTISQHGRTTGSQLLWDASPWQQHAVPALTKASFTPTKAGWGYNANASATRSEYATTGVLLGGQPSNVSCFAIGDFRLTGTIEGVLGYWYAGGGTGPGAADQVFEYNVRSDGACQVRLHTGSITLVSSALGAMTAGWHAYSCSLGQGQRIKAYVDGKPVIDAVCPNAAFRASTHTGQDDLVIANLERNWTGSFPGDMTIALMLIWNRPLSDADHVSLTSDPWQMFKPVDYTHKAIALGINEALSPGVSVVVTPSLLVADNAPARRRPKQRKLNRNISWLGRGNEKNSIEALRRETLDIHQAVVELQDAQVSARNVDSKGFPLHGEWCETFGGQYMKITSLGIDPATSLPKVFALSHNLQRVPQGMIFIRQGANGGGTAQVFIEGDITRAIPPATDKLVYYDHNGPANSFSYGILI